MKKLFILLAVGALSLTATADDLFYEDGKINTARGFTWQGDVLDSVQIGARRPDGVEIFHSKGVVIVPLQSLPALWQKEIWKRAAASLAPAGAAPQVLTQIAAALPEAAAIATRRAEVSSRKADGTSFAGNVIAGKDKALLLATKTAAAWMPEAAFSNPQSVRDELNATLTPQLHADVRKRVVDAEWAKADATGAPKKVRQKAVADAMKAWDQTHPRPSSQPPTAKNKSKRSKGVPVPGGIPQP